jgi:hypothetical protein
MNQPTEPEFLDDVGLKKPDRSASIMHCIYKAYEVDGLQNELITTTLNWVRDCIAKSQT